MSRDDKYTETRAQESRDQDQESSIQDPKTQDPKTPDAMTKDMGFVATVLESDKFYNLDNVGATPRNIGSALGVAFPNSNALGQLLSDFTDAWTLLDLWKRDDLPQEFVTMKDDLGKHLDLVVSHLRKLHR